MRIDKRIGGQRLAGMSPSRSLLAPESISKALIPTFQRAGDPRQGRRPVAGSATSNRSGACRWQTSVISRSATVTSTMYAATTGMSLAAAVVSGAAIIACPPVQADAVAYLVNVTVRPGYNFPNADAVLRYGYGICDKVATGRVYPDLVGDVKADFNTSDEFQASYLISQPSTNCVPH
jgi:hypothetical protein